MKSPVKDHMDFLMENVALAAEGSAASKSLLYSIPYLDWVSMDDQQYMFTDN